MPIDTLRLGCFIKQTSPKWHVPYYPTLSRWFSDFSGAAGATFCRTNAWDRHGFAFYRLAVLTPVWRVVPRWRFDHGRIQSFDDQKSRSSKSLGMAKRLTLSSKCPLLNIGLCSFYNKFWHTIGALGKQRHLSADCNWLVPADSDHWELTGAIMCYPVEPS